MSFILMLIYFKMKNKIMSKKYKIILFMEQNLFLLSKIYIRIRDDFNIKLQYNTKFDTLLLTTLNISNLFLFIKY